MTQVQLKYRRVNGTHVNGEEVTGGKVFITPVSRWGTSDGLMTTDTKQHTVGDTVTLGAGSYRFALEAQNLRFEEMRIVPSTGGPYRVDQLTEFNAPQATASLPQWRAYFDDKIQEVLNNGAPVTPLSIIGSTTVGRDLMVISDEAAARIRLGLSAVDNTSDADKPVSSATQAALNGKQNTNTSLQQVGALTRSDDSVLQVKGGAWNTRTPAQLRDDMSLDTAANLRARSSHTGTQSADTLTDGTTNKAFTATERTKLSGVATGATANDTDGNLKSRANHTGTQAISTVSGLQADLDARAEKPAAAINSLTGWYHANGYSGVDPTGATDSTTGLMSWLAALPSSGGAVAYLPQGTYLCNTVTSTYVLRLLSKSRITIRGGGNGATIRTTTAVADDLFLVKDCNLFRLENVFFEAQGTSAEIQRAVHVTTSSPGSAGRAVLEKLYIRALGNFRKVYDISCTSGSPTIWSAQAAFTGADVGAMVLLNLSDGPFTSRVTAAAAVTTTLSAAITTTSQTSISLTSALSGAPASGFTIVIDNERMFVSAGGNTTTLTVSRARGNKAAQPAATHSSGATVSTSYATLANNATVTVSNSVVPARIQDANTSVIHVGVGIGCDNPGASNMDIAGNIIRECAFNRCHKAGVQVGNGTSGNTLDHRAYALSTFECGVGVWMYGGALSVHGGECSLNLVDFKQVVSASQDLVIEGVRSENAALFWELTGAATAGSAVKLTGIEVASFNAEDGVVVRHLSSRPLTLDTITLKNIDTATGAVYCSVAGTPSNPCTLAVTGSVSSNGQNSDLFPSSSSLIRTIFASPRLSGSNFIKNTVVGSLFDNKVHMLGGVVRGRTTVADAAYTILASDSLVVYTSLTAARVVTLPAQGSTLPAGQEFVIKDESGSCDGTKTLTITPPSGTIDGASSVVINTAYGSKTVYTNGTNWFTR